MTWVVKRCFMDYDEEWKIVYSEYDTEQDAEQVAENLRVSSSDPNEWYEVEEE